MAQVNWPSGLPSAFEAQGFRDALPDRVVRSTIEGGVVNARQRNRRGRRAPMSGTMYMTTAQWLTMRTFYHDALGAGALPFNFPDPEDEATDIEAVFTAPPQLSTIGGDLHSVSLNMERI